MLRKSPAAWGSEEFKSIFTHEILQLGLDALPLQQALNSGSYALADDIKIMLNHTDTQGDILIVRAGIFYNSVIAGCNCADDPSAVDTQSEYCEVEFLINRHTAETDIRLC